MWTTNGGWRRSGLRLTLALLLAAGIAAPAIAYVPGTGTVYSDDFEGQLDADWEQGNGFLESPSPWTQIGDGTDTSFYADGRGPLPNSSSLHWAQHFIHPVSAGSFSIALEYRGEMGAGYTFDLQVEQRAPQLRKYRLRVGADGSLTLWRTEGGVFTQVAGTAPATVAANQRTWLRLALEPDAGGHNWIRVRNWEGGAQSEPVGWTLEYLDQLDVIERVHRFELIADGPAGVRTWLDDLDVYGDAGSGVASSIRTIYIAEWSHLDIGFTEPPDDIEVFAKTHLDQVLDNLDADPEYHWTIEESWWLDRWWERSTAAEHQRMVDFLRSGRIELAAGYASLHTTKTGPEELQRSVYYASRMAREHGFPLRTLILDDVPGGSFALPEILARAGMEFYIGGMNASFGGRLTEPDHGDRPFWWVGPDGSRVLAWITFDSYAEGLKWGFSFFDNLSDLYQKMAAKLPEQEEAGYPYPEMMLLRAFDNHYQGFKVRDLVNQWNATYETPKFQLVTPSQFFDHMIATYGAESFPSYSGDFGCAWSGSNASAQHTQELIRQAHRDGRDGEALVAAARALDNGSGRDDERWLLYRKMLESDEHSGAGGWPGYYTPEEYDRNARIHLSYAQTARDTAQSLIDDGADRLVADLPAGGDALAVINGLGRQRDAWVRVALPAALYSSTFRVVDRVSGSERPYQRFDASSEILFRAEALPAMGYKVFDLLPGTPTATPSGLLSVSPDALENDFYRVEISSSDGSVTSFYDKLRGRELLDFASAYRFNELAHNTHADTTTGALPIAWPPDSASLSIGEQGPLMASLIVSRGGTPHVETIYRLWNGDDRVEIENALDRDLMPYVVVDAHSWKYMVTLPFDVHDFQIRTESPTRFLDPLADGFARDSVFDWHNVEHTLAFWDANGGIHAAADSISAWHFERLVGLANASFKNSNGLLLPRMIDKSDEYEFEDGHVGPVVLEPGTSSIYRSTLHFRATASGFDPVDAAAWGYDTLTPVRSRLLERRPGNLPAGSASAFGVDAPGVLLYTAKPAEDGRGSVLRMVELLGAETPLHVSSSLLTITAAERLELDEEGGSPLPVDGQGVSLTLGAFETATIRVEAHASFSPIDLRVDKNEPSGAVELSWTGGVTPFTVQRSATADFLSRQTLVDEQDVTSHSDPVLGDGQVWYYLVR